MPLNVGERGQPERAYAQLVSANFFTALGLRPAVGRFLRPDEVSVPGGAPVVVISHDYWQARPCRGAPDVIGRTIRVSDRDLAIIGVTPEGFQGTVLGLQFDLFLPATLAPVFLPGAASSTIATSAAIR